MPEITITCSKCGSEFKIDDAQGRTAVSCSQCQSTILVPLVGIKQGTKIADFEVIRKLGVGGMGEVWLAKQVSMDRDVALKILSPALAENEEFASRFSQEVKMVGKLNHPNIISAYYAGVDNGIHFLAISYIEGKKLEDLMESEKKIPEKRALQIIRSIALALKYAWDKYKILHRDIKPSNIMINSENEPMLMDMGISKSLAEDKSLTLTGMVIGTAHYMSPEQGKGEELDFRSDLYSLGATLYHMVTGSVPYDSSNATGIIAKQITEFFPPPRERCPEVSEECAVLLEIMMAKNADERQSSWDDLIKDIDLVLEGKFPVTPRPKTEMTYVDQSHPIIQFYHSETEKEIPVYSGTEKELPVHSKVGKDVPEPTQKKSGGTSSSMKVAAISVLSLLLIIGICFGIINYMGNNDENRESDSKKGADPSTISGSHLQGQLGILDVTANGGINPATGKAWKIGDKYRLMFVSTATIDATSSDIATYNTFVQKAATGSSLNLTAGGVTWKAIASTNSIDARDNTSTNQETNGKGEAIFLTDGRKYIAANYADLWDSEINTLPELTEENKLRAKDTPLFDTWVGTWTGTSPYGIKEDPSPLGTSSPRHGVASGDINANWISRSNGDNTNRLPMYAISEPLEIMVSSSQSDDPQLKDKTGNGSIMGKDDKKPVTGGGAEQPLKKPDQQPGGKPKKTTPIWISEDATYTVSSNSGMYGKPASSLLDTTPSPPKNSQFAFHTNKEKEPNIVIDLGKIKQVTSIYIENRKIDWQKRAEDLTVWLSMEKSFKEKYNWRAKSVEKEWTVEFPEPIKTRYIKIGLPGNDRTLHLARVKVFGWDSEKKESTPALKTETDGSGKKDSNTDVTNDKKSEKPINLTLKEVFDQLSFKDNGFELKDNCISGPFIDGEELEYLSGNKSDFNGKCEYSFKIKARWYHGALLVIDGKKYYISVGHWANNGIQVITDTNEVKFRGENDKIKGDMQQEWQEVKIVINNGNISYFYNDKEIHKEPVDIPKNAKLQFGVSLYRCETQLKDFSLKLK